MTEPGRRSAPPVGGPSRELTAAVVLMVVRVTLGLAVAAAQLADAATVRTAIGTANPPLTGAQVQTVYDGIVGVAIIAGLGYAGLYALLIMQIRRARSWARTATRLLAGLSALAALSSLSEPDSVVGHPLAMAILPVDVAVLVLLSLPAANRFFSQPAPSPAADPAV
ncbi:MAG: hypothetical protein V7637_3910 [Mycobacteriales bacterium]